MAYWNSFWIAVIVFSVENYSMPIYFHWFSVILIAQILVRNNSTKFLSFDWIGNDSYGLNYFAHIGAVCEIAARLEIAKNVSLWIENIQSAITHQA